MKIFFSCIIFLQYIKIIFAIIPVWNFKSSVKELLNDQNEYILDYEVSSGRIWGHNSENYSLRRKIYLDSKTGIIRKENNLYKDNVFFGSTEYDDIESAYRELNKQVYYICPKGRYHVYYYNITNEGKIENGTLKIDKVFNDNDNWDLKCYYQYYEHYLFISYMNSDTNFYQYDFEKGEFLYNASIDEGLYAYSWEIGQGINKEKQMFAIIKKDNHFKLEDFRFNVYNYSQNKHFDYTRQADISLTELKSKYQAFFTLDDQTTFYYFINYNNETDFQSGYCKYGLDISNIQTIEKPINEASPFIFFENVTINEIRFIYFTKYIYYNISINDTNNFYYGIIDITLNKIIFNTNENLLYFKPYYDNSMLAITNKMAYQICAIASNDGECLNKCENDEIIVDSTKKNYCGKKCDGDNIYTLKPDNICVEKCDENIYYIDDNKKECWLCKDIEENKKFKLIDISEAGCLQNKPENSYYMNKNLYLVTCYEGFNYFKGGNCVKDCSDGFFHKKESHLCDKCNENCKSCNNIDTNCTKCEEDEYLYLNETLLTYSCNKCYNNCKTCSQGKEDDTIKCLSCYNNSTYKFLYNNNCVENCPPNFIISENNECIFIEKNDLGKKDTLMLSIFIIITALILLIIIICFCKSVFCNSKKEEESLINQINTELIENKELFN